MEGVGGRLLEGDDGYGLRGEGAEARLIKEGEWMMIGGLWLTMCCTEGDLVGGRVVFSHWGCFLFC